MRLATVMAVASIISRNPIHSGSMAVCKQNPRRYRGAANHVRVTFFNKKMRPFQDNYMYVGIALPRHLYFKLDSC